MKKIFAFILTIALLSFATAETPFTVVCKSGVIIGKYGKLVYVLPEADKEFRYVYNLSLKTGTYQFITFDKTDSVSFAVDLTGVYKLGFYENHPSFTILKDPVF